MRRSGKSGKKKDLLKLWCWRLTVHKVWSLIYNASLAASYPGGRVGVEILRWKGRHWTGKGQNALLKNILFSQKMTIWKMRLISSEGEVISNPVILHEDPSLNHSSTFSFTTQVPNIYFINLMNIHTYPNYLWLIKICYIYHKEHTAPND